MRAGTPTIWPALAALALGCGTDGDRIEIGSPRVVLGVADIETSSRFLPFSPGDTLYYARQGQAALLLRFALRAWNLGNRLTGQVTIVDRSSGRSAEQTFANLLLACQPEGYCEQLPVYVALHALGSPDELQGRRIEVTAWFEPRNGGPRVSVSTWGILSGFDAVLPDVPNADTPFVPADAGAPDDAAPEPTTDQSVRSTSRHASHKQVQSDRRNRTKVSTCGVCGIMS